MRSVEATFCRERASCVQSKPHFVGNVARPVPAKPFFVGEVLRPFRRSQLFVGNVARPVPAKPSFRRVRRLYRRSRVLRGLSHWCDDDVAPPQSAEHQSPPISRYVNGECCGRSKAVPYRRYALRLFSGRHGSRPLHHKKPSYSIMRIAIALSVSQQEGIIGLKP